MIINIWQYVDALEGVAAPSLKQELAYTTAMSRARYIFDMRLTDTDAQVMLRVKTVGEYIDRDSPTGDRITGRYAYNMGSEDPEGLAAEIAIQAGRAGLDRFWHIVVSSREGEDLDEEQLEHVRQTVLKVLGVDACPSVWATHGDTEQQHSHGLIVSYRAAYDERIPFGQGWWKEAGQIAMAIIERDLELDPEPNRRFVADRTGVYDTFNDMKVADKDGHILGRSVITSMQKANDALKRENYAAVGLEPGTEWDLKRAVQMLAARRIQDAKTPEEMHESLARVGLRYIASETGAQLVATGYRPAPGKNAGGQAIAAGEAYANAALGKLSKRFEPSGGYRPANSDVNVRRFVMPRFNRLDEQAGFEFAAHQAELEEAAELLTHLERHNGKAYRHSRDTQKGANANAARSTSKQLHLQELKVATRIKKSLAAKSGSMRDAGIKQAIETEPQETVAVIWGPPPGKPNVKKLERINAERREIEERYQVERGNGQARYWLDGQLAFIERLRTIELVTRRRRARIDALKLARRKFREVSFAARHRIRVSLARIATELRVRIRAGWMNKIGRIHGERLVNGTARSAVDASRRFHETAVDRKLAADEVKVSRLHTNRRIEFARGHENPLGAKALLGLYLRDDPSRTIGGNADRDPATGAGLRRLVEELDHDCFLLASSRQTYAINDKAIRFLDDEALVRSFGESPEILVDTDVQRALRAIELLQLEKRRWVAAAVAAGHAILEAGDLSVKGHPDHWAERFWRAQRHDPTFLRLIHVARARPDRFPFDSNAKPEEEVLHAAMATDDWQIQFSILGVIQRRSPVALIAQARHNADVRKSKEMPGASSPAGTSSSPEQRTPSKPISQPKRGPQLPSPVPGLEK